MELKSEIINAIDFFVTIFEKNFKATEISVFKLTGLNSINSLMILKICDFPLLGGINNSIWSENNINPTLSLFWIAAKILAKNHNFGIAEAFWCGVSWFATKF